LGGYESASMRAVLRAARGLHLFRGVLEDDTGRSFLALLETLAADGAEAEPGDILEAYARFFSLLAKEAESAGPAVIGDAWQRHLLDRLLFDENPFSHHAQMVGAAAMSPALLEAAALDLRILQRFFRLEGTVVAEMLSIRLGGAQDSFVPWSGLLSPSASHDGREDPSAALRVRFAETSDWAVLLPDLASHYAAKGAGLFARYRAFRWVRRNGHSYLEGILHSDPVRLDDLVEYEAERALLLQNTEQFVRGFRANNVLLYGERGTGKSSTIKALLNRYGDQGLRMVEVPKGLLEEFPRILGILRGRRERFVLFVDDLSFDERETSYKELKAVLEGGLEARPDNVVVYATSNRRHLVQERFSDRAGGDGEIRGWDSHQEKLSLADRFGVTLVFSAPDQERYLRIVGSLARQRGLDVGTDHLRARSLEWAAQQGGFSGRTARQFVDHLAGELGIKALRPAE